MAARKQPIGYGDALNTPERRGRLDSFLNQLATGLGVTSQGYAKKKVHPFIQLQNDLSAKREAAHSNILQRKARMRPIGSWRKWQQAANETFKTGQ